MSRFREIEQKVNSIELHASVPSPRWVTIVYTGGWGGHDRIEHMKLDDLIDLRYAIDRTLEEAAAQER